MTSDILLSRPRQIAAHFIAHQSTIRDTAKVFGVSKSTVWKDLTERLPKLDKAQYERVRKVLDKNAAERHIRGGIATKSKWEVIACERHF